MSQGLEGFFVIMVAVYSKDKLDSDDFISLTLKKQSVLTIKI